MDDATIVGVYCALLTVDDKAGNHQVARKFFIFDATNTVSISTHVEEKLWVPSAAENTSYQWVTDLNDKVSYSYYWFVSYYVIVPL